MRAIVINEYGGPEQLIIKELPEPRPEPGQVVIEVKAFGLNHAETYMRKGLWGDVAKVTGIECVGVVKADPAGKFAQGQKVIAIMGGMGRVINGSYAEYTRLPSTNVVAVSSALSWHELTAIPECYATAWACLFGNLDLKCGQTLLIRGATSALGQAALNIAAHAGSRVIATTRSPERLVKLESLGAETALVDAHDLSRRVRDSHPAGIDAVLDLVGNSTLLDSLAMVGRHGRVCQAGFLGGLAPLESFNPLLQGRTACTSAFLAASCSEHLSFPCPRSLSSRLLIARWTVSTRQSRSGPLCSMRLGMLTGLWSRTRQMEKLS